MKPNFAPLVTALTLGFCLTFSSGCVSHVIARAFTDAPNGGLEAVDPDRPTPAIYDDHGQLEVPGPPAATLAYWVMEPGPARILALAEDAEGSSPDLPPGWRYADANPRKDKGFIRTKRGPADTAAPARATVILLHGWGSKVRSSDTLWHLSATLADAGCRVILPDLRGQGDSTGEFVTLGFREAQDLSFLLDEFHDAAHPVGVVGHSYGGGIAIGFAAHDPRVKRVLALAPLADIRKSMLPGVREFAKRFRPIAWAIYLNWAIDQKAIDKAQVIMEERTGGDFDIHNALYQIQKLEAPVLILQGGQDPATPLVGAEALRDANPKVVELIVYPEGSHTSFLRDNFADVETRLRDWAENLIDSPLN